MDSLEVIKSIIANVLTALYQPFWYAVLSSILLGFIYLYAYNPVESGKGLRKAIKGWAEEFKTSIFFRKLFILFFFSVMILFRRFINRNMWANPLSNVMGDWWIWREKNGEKQLTTECLENLILMMPFIFVLFWTFEEKMKKANLRETVWNGLKISFVISFTIEMLQLFLRLGTWQISDIFYNTIGGGIGGLMCYVFRKVKYRNFDK